MCMTGNGATFSLANGPNGEVAPGSIGRLISVDGFDVTATAIEDDDLATSTLMKYCFAKIKGHTPLQLGVVFDPDVHMSIMLGKVGLVLTATLGFPLPAGQSTPGSLTGTGAIISAPIGQLINNERSETTIEWQFDAATTPPAYTASAA